MLLHALLDLPQWWLMAALLLALWIDVALGEPPVRVHPVVWMGNYLGWAGRVLQKVARPWTELESGNKPDWRAFWAGVGAWSAGALAVLAVCAALVVGLLWLRGDSLFPAGMGGPGGMGAVVANGIHGGTAGTMPGGLNTGINEGMAGQGAWALHLPHWVTQGLAVVLLGFLLKPLLAWAMLRSEVRAVEHAMTGQGAGHFAAADAQTCNLAAGRERLSWLVSRDVSALSEAGVRESAIESLAENLSDSVVAPIFWWLLLGLPGAALYRFANTADAMWGYRGAYRGATWEWAGKWAARVDDVLNWLPARLTGCALWVVGRLGSGPRQNIDVPFATLVRQASLTPSPNSGWPMAAMALALGVSLNKPGVYVLNQGAPAPLAPTTQKATALAGRVVQVVTWVSVLLIAFVALASSPEASALLRWLMEGASA